jgi:SAM-dependent methyltransferase
MPAVEPPARCPYCRNQLADAGRRSNPRVGRCQVCRLQWPMAARRPPLQATPAGYPPLSSANGEHEREIRLWKSRFQGLFPGGSVLDVGSAGGHWLAALARHGLRPEGIEQSPAAVAFAREGRLASVYCAPFSRSCLPNGLSGRRFDAISFRESLYYMPDLSEAFSLVRELLAPRGYLYIKAHLATSRFYDTEPDILRRFGTAATFLPTLDGLKTVLAREGFELIDWRNWEFDAFRGSSLASRVARRIVRSALGRAPWARADRVVLLARQN